MVKQNYTTYISVDLAYHEIFRANVGKGGIMCIILGKCKLQNCLPYLQSHILGQKRNAAYEPYIIYGGSFTNLSQTFSHSFSADSWIMSSWGCASYHCHRTKWIHQFKPTFLSILMSRH